MEKKAKKTTAKNNTKTKDKKQVKTVAKKTVNQEKKVPSKKSTTKKSVAPKRVEAKAETVKKTVPKKEVKKAPKKAETKEVKVTPKKVEPKVEEVVKEQVYEKTYVFNKEEQEDLNAAVERMSKTKVPSYEGIGKIDRNNRGVILFLTSALVIVVLLCAIYVVVNINKDESVEGNYIDDTSYRSINDSEKKIDTFKDADYSNLINTSIDDFEVKVAEGKKMLVLISSDTCYYCVTFEPILNEVLVSKKANAIRLNISNMNDLETKRLRSYYPFVAAPTLLFIVDGEVNADITGFMDKDSLITWYDNNTKI